LKTKVKYLKSLKDWQFI